MAWSTEDAAKQAYHPKPPRHKISPSVISQALGLEGTPRWVFRDGLYRCGPTLAFPPHILDLPIDEAIALAKRCCER